MINKKLIFALTFLLNLGTQQINASQIHQKLNSSTPAQNKLQITLGGKKIESRSVPEYFKFKQGQKRTFDHLCDDLKSIIAEFIDFNRSANECSNDHPFVYAICNQDCNTVQLLVALRADLHDKKNCSKHSHKTPLHAAISKYSFESCMFEILGESHTIKKQKAVAILDYLLRKKIGVNKPGTWQETPIYRAIDNKLIDVIEKLITAQADLSVKSHKDQTPLDRAKKNTMEQLVDKSYRKENYAICNMLEKAGAPSSVVLKPMPIDKK